MNPEEGELRPQLLDRFGLNVRLDTQPPPAERAEIIRRRLAFDADPQAFVERWEGQQDTCAAVAPRHAGNWRGFPWTMRRWIASPDAASRRLSMACAPTWSGCARAPCGLARRRADRGGGHRCGGTFRPAASPSPVEPAAIGGQSTATARGLPRSRKRAGDGEGQWGELPARPVAMGTARELPRWPKALSIRPRSVMGADARSRPGALRGGLGGALSQGAEGAIQWLPTLLRGRPRQRRDLLRQPRSRHPGELWLVIVDASASTRRYGALAQPRGCWRRCSRRPIGSASAWPCCTPPGSRRNGSGRGRRLRGSCRTGYASWAPAAVRRCSTPCTRPLAGWRADSGRNPPSISVCWCLPTAACATGRRCRRLPARVC